MENKRTREEDDGAAAPLAPYDPNAPIEYESMSSIEVQAAITSAIYFLRDVITKSAAAAAASGTGSGAAVPLPTAQAVHAAASIRSRLSKLVFKFGSPERAKPIEPMPSRNRPTAEPRVFGALLDDLPQKKVGTLEVPAPFADLMDEIRKRDLSTEGIFRVAGNKRRKQVLRAAIEGGESYADVPDLNIHDFCDVFKELLREVPEKVIPPTFAAIFSGIARMLETKADERDIVNALQLFHLILPPVNRRLMQLLIGFLADIHAKSDANLMHASNLAKVLIPNLSQEDCVSTDPAGIADTQTKLAALFAFTIEHASSVFFVPKSVAGQRAILFGPVPGSRNDKENDTPRKKRVKVDSSTPAAEASSPATLRVKKGHAALRSGSPARRSAATTASAGKDYNPIFSAK